ncbi:GIY-YIG nuclease family protein [Mesonia aquimarina]|uniref:GIY-YIG nuclease family protein n=1 Tax=Mesonia aquimarina TaxID=1504967 RepID=UPI000EF58358|nr:GIY-YIG nuclease family protein [Mesonia aquimarina]
MKLSYVYILSNKYRTTFYIGVTNDLKQRLYEHSEETGSKFTSKYNIKDLLYFEKFTEINQAILREKQLKNWKKDWKINLIKDNNPKLETLVL